MSQAIRCTSREVRALIYWRRRGVMLGLRDTIPLHALTPPSFATRRPVLDAFAGGCIAVVAVLVGCAWLAHGAGVLL